MTLRRRLLGATSALALFPPEPAPPRDWLTLPALILLAVASAAALAWIVHIDALIR